MKPQTKFPAATWRLLIILVLLVGAACSRNATPQPDKTGENTGEKVVITFAADEYNRRLYEPLIKTFNEQNPNIEVQFVNMRENEPVVEGDWDANKWFRSLASAADVTMISGRSEFDMTRYFRNLQPLLESDAAFQVDDFYKGAFSACDDAYGNRVGIPSSVYLTGLFYDGAAFDAAGLPYPGPGWTLEDFRRAISSLALKEGGQARYGFMDQFYIYGSILAPVIEDHLMAHGGEVDPKALLSEVQWYVDLARTEALFPIIDTTDEANSDVWSIRDKAFQEGNPPAMWTDSLISSIPGFYEWDMNNPMANMAIAKYGFAPFPSLGSNTNTTPAWGECMAISAGSTHPREAWAWINFLSRQWLVVDKSQVWELGRVPARKSVAAEVEYWSLLPEKVRPSVEYAMDHLWFSGTNYIKMEEVNFALARHIAGAANFEDALAERVAQRQETPEPTPDNRPIVVATPRPPLPEGVSEVKYYPNMYNENEMKALRSLAEQYNQAHPEKQIKIVMEYYGEPSEDYMAGMAKEMDCFTWGSPWWDGTDASVFLSLNSLVAAEPATFINDFDPKLMDVFRNEGELYALPASRQMQIVGYNADLLAKRGLSTPSNDWTFDDFMKMVEAAASSDPADTTYGYILSPWDDLFLIGQGIKWADLNSDPPVAYLDSPEMTRYLNWMKDAVKAGVFLMQDDNNWEAIDKAMRNGQIAFWTTSMGEPVSWYFSPNEAPPYNAAVAPFPSMPENSPNYSWSNDRGHYISASTKEAKACWDWIKFLSEQPNIFGGVPARRSVMESPAWEASLGSATAAVYRAALANSEVMKPGEVFYSPIGWPFYTWRGELVTEALKGDQIRQAANLAQSKAEAYLDCMSTVDITDMSGEETSQQVQSCAKQADPTGQW